MYCAMNRNQPHDHRQVRMPPAHLRLVLLRDCNVRSTGFEFDLLHNTERLMLINKLHVENVGNIILPAAVAESARCG